MCLAKIFVQIKDATAVEDRFVREINDGDEKKREKQFENRWPVRESKLVDAYDSTEAN